MCYILNIRVSVFFFGVGCLSCQIYTSWKVILIVHMMNSFTMNQARHDTGKKSELNE